MYDLNVPWPRNNYEKLTDEQVVGLRNVIVTLYSLKVYKVAINFEIDESIRLPVNSPQEINPIKVPEIIDVAKFPGLSVYTRLTVVVNDSSKLVSFNKFQNYFDLVAIKPVSEKALQLSIINLNIDLISVALSSRLNFYLKHKIVGQAIKKGVKFEICYDSLISSSSSMSRKHLISNLIQLIRATRSNGVVIAGGCTDAINVRSLNNIVNFFETLGLKRNKINQFIENSRYVLMNGRLRINSYKQVIALDDDDELLDNSKDDPMGNSVVNGYKKQKRKGDADEQTVKRTKI
ncbi:RNA-binding RNA processing protein rpp1 [Yamadazyma tenuis]|uniref:PHP domain-like protein n=1 Tax=Candida tenuis (strain ATCC 10573 / BCRC 21748 / CBS 615 / JCM 9827 / NBRC 10315 / NRRL Y-1498 / VKM Y-70) TaxID=590646 RepID=G3B6V4_CANTC|nr:PHP domain-like protein [Yamadazyma tenuis ATCC 10573]XP_006687310.1 uncharacterized protein CANTEDRAFT_114336 [Yamadazyma tenuis ATCC 10573]EGV63516.1 PHP domain-like protein [Yamadazyma tenuis ATCC 10573]EGV63517.1 hypothetical protein CANTEDRAFT_114336 [Yamadazyma tenuis ATCC 10573]WEJ97153.1 RNA-binding RNA processing protein rpp1 [Yamadazyma tenuis]